MRPRLQPPVGPRDHARGEPDASVILVMFGDFECAVSGTACLIIRRVRAVLREHLRLVFRHFPLTRRHPHAQHAAEIAEAAATGGVFWAMHDVLYDHQDALEDTDLVDYAVQLGLDGSGARDVLRRHVYADVVREHFESGVRSGVNGTPTLFINDVRYDGPQGERELLLALQYASRSAPESVTRGS